MLSLEGLATVSSRRESSPRTTYRPGFRASFLRVQTQAASLYQGIKTLPLQIRKRSPKFTSSPADSADDRRSSGASVPGSRVWYHGNKSWGLSPGYSFSNAALKAPWRLSLSRVPDTRSLAFGRPRNDRASRILRLLT